MIRSLAALFARKTAIVAITGVTVIGGATLALGAEGDPPEEPAEIDTGSTETETETETESTTTTEATTTTTEATTTTTVAEVDETEEVDETDAERTTSDVETAEPDTSTADAGHGAMVSDAARNICHKPENIEHYGNHGQCVKDFAHGIGVDHSVTAGDVAPGGSEAARDEDDDAAETMTAPAPTEEPAKGKPAHAGPPAGGGKGKGGKG